MQKNILKKIFAVAVLFLFFLIVTLPSIQSAGETKFLNILDMKSEYLDNIIHNKYNNIVINSIQKNNQSSDLVINEITGGIGLSFLLKNQGNISIFDIIINIKITSKFIKLKNPKQIIIPSLAPGEEKKIELDLFGFGIRDLFYYNRIKISINALNCPVIKRIAVVNVAGPFVDVLGVFSNDEDSYGGYILYSPEYSHYTYLIDKDCNIVHSWKSDYIQGITYHLLENGNLVRNCLSNINPTFLVGGATGRVEIFDWNGSLIWEFEYSDENNCLHHDIEILPNGNILMIAWEVKTNVEAIAAGRNPLLIPAGFLWSSYIIEVDPSLPSNENIVWEWHVWDHLIQDYDSTKENFDNVADHPELININYGIPFGLYDWNHMNSLDYNEELDQILISSHIQNEIWVIDHSTTKNEAAGHVGGRYGKGGDLLYRWGNPQVYYHGTEDDQILYGQHDARWIKKGCPGYGNILIFNNGFIRPDLPYSSVEEIIPPIDIRGNYILEDGSAYGPEKAIWTYTSENPTDFFASIQSGAQRLENGNTIICNGPAGVLFEVTAQKDVVWKYTNMYPTIVNNRVDKLNFYPLNYPGLGEFNTNVLHRNVLEKMRIFKLIYSMIELII